MDADAGRYVDAPFVRRFEQLPFSAKSLGGRRRRVAERRHAGPEDERERSCFGLQVLGLAKVARSIPAQALSTERLEGAAFHRC